jgi:hypothetical protein
MYKNLHFQQLQIRMDKIFLLRKPELVPAFSPFWDVPIPKLEGGAIPLFLPSILPLTHLPFM